MSLLVEEKATATDSHHPSTSPLPALLTNLPPLKSLVKVGEPAFY